MIDVEKNSRITSDQLKNHADRLKVLIEVLKETRLECERILFIIRGHKLNQVHRDKLF